MKEPIIQNLFPTPVYMTNMDRPFTKQELNFVENEKKHTTKNDGNTSSIDNYILNRKELKEVDTKVSEKKFLKIDLMELGKKYDPNNPKHNKELKILKDEIEVLDN